MDDVAKPGRALDCAQGAENTEDTNDAHSAEVRVLMAGRRGSVSDGGEGSGVGSCGGGYMMAQDYMYVLSQHPGTHTHAHNTYNTQTRTHTHTHTTHTPALAWDGPQEQGPGSTR